MFLRGARGAPAARAATATTAGPAPPPSCFVDEYEDEEPTPFPQEKVLPDEILHLITLLDESNESPLEEDDLFDALEAVTDLHETDMNWLASWPKTILEVKSDAVSTGLFKLVRCVLHVIENEDGDVRFSAIDLLHSLISSGNVPCRVGALFVLECGAIPVLVPLGRVIGDRKIFSVLTELVKGVPVALLPKFFDAGIIEAAQAVLDDFDSLPMEQHAAMKVLSALCLKAPAWTARAGAYEAVLNITNEALLPKRNQIMSFLRPIVFAEGDKPPMTNMYQKRPSW